MKDIAGKEALVIGGSGGIGAHISRGLARAGARLTIHGSREGEGLRALAEELSALSVCRTIIHRFCAADAPRLIPDSIGAAIEKADILCLCYGPFLQKPLHLTTDEDWHEVVSLNYTLSGMAVSRAVRAMAERGFGRILLFGGTRTQTPLPFLTNAAYAGAKTAVSALVRSAASAYAEAGLTCNAILPGFTDTEYIPESVKRTLADRMPGGDLISPETIAETALFLLSHKEINGALVNMDAGWDPFFHNKTT